MSTWPCLDHSVSAIGIVPELGKSHGELPEPNAFVKGKPLLLFPLPCHWTSQISYCYFFYCS
jgi:hypothetical protein